MKRKKLHTCLLLALGCFKTTGQVPKVLSFSNRRHKIVFIVYLFAWKVFIHLIYFLSPQVNWLSPRFSVFLVAHVEMFLPLSSCLQLLGSIDYYHHLLCLTCEAVVYHPKVFLHFCDVKGHIHTYFTVITKPLCKWSSSVQLFYCFLARNYFYNAYICWLW